MTDQTYYRSFFNRDRVVHVVDPDLQTCETLSLLFRLEGFQTAFSVNLDGFFAGLERRRPDVVIVNFDLAADEGLSLLKRVKAMRMGTPVFMLENRPDVDAAVVAMKAGATDVVTKPIDNEHLVRLVREALRHDIHIGAVEDGRRPVEVRGFSQLTRREREVLQLITNGQSNKEAGRELGISPRTIEVHRARVMEKLGARNTADLMRIVLTS
jgi:two-component system, LuxR family, response regulator FixJ